MPEYLFDRDIAVKYGVDEAIVIRNLKFWIEKNAANKRHIYDGRVWTYNTLDAFQKLFPFWSVKQIRRILSSLLDQNVIVKGNYNKAGYDRTLWYAFADSSICPFGQMELTERANGIDQMGEPIPDSKPDERQHDSLRESGDVSRKTSIPYRRISPWWECLELLKQKINHFRLPEKPEGCLIETPDIECSKTVLMVIGYLESISKGTFQRDIKYKGDFHLKPMESTKVLSVLGRVLKVLDKLRDPEYWPEDKANVEKIRVVQFFLNPRSGHSWFMWCLENRPSKLRETSFASRPSEELMNEAARIVGRKTASLSWALDELLTWADSILSIPDLRIQDNWEQFNSADRIACKFLEFIDGYGGGPAVGHIKSLKVRDQFIAWSMSKYGVDLTGESDAFKQMLREQPDEKPDIVRFDFDIWAGIFVPTHLIPDDVGEAVDMVLRNWDHSDTWYTMDGGGVVIESSGKKLSREHVEETIKRFSISL